jgi:hypothetical protein
MEVAMGGNGDPNTITDLVSRARSLVSFLLVCLDDATDYIAELDAAFKTEDAYRALVGNERLQRAWSHAYATIKILELLSGAMQPNARKALTTSYQRARPSLALAWNLISRIPIAHLSQ